jgi:hypothetical protein
VDGFGWESGRVCFFGYRSAAPSGINGEQAYLDYWIKVVLHKQIEQKPRVKSGCFRSFW